MFDLRTILKNVVIPVCIIIISGLPLFLPIVSPEWVHKCLDVLQSAQETML